MTRAIDPTFRDLDDSEMNALLSRNHVGRIAFSFRNRVDIQPIHYIFADNAIYMRTEPGSKLTTLAHAPWVAFEVDEVDGPFDWRSVVVHGTVYVLDDEGPERGRELYDLALERLRELMPDALTADDPAPSRRVILKLHPASLAGREARSSRPAGRSRAARTPIRSQLPDDRRQTEPPDSRR